MKEETLDRTLGENWFWKRLWTCRNTRHGMNEYMIVIIKRKYLENILSQFHFALHKSRVSSSPPFCISMLLLLEAQAGEAWKLARRAMSLFPEEIVSCGVTYSLVQKF